MSRFSRFRVEQLNDYSLNERKSKVRIEDLARTPSENSLTAFLESLPNILAGKDLRELVAAIKRAKRLGKPIIWGFGGHVVKVGLGPVLASLMENGYVTALATNGSGIIHDFEMALSGHTSEDVDQQLGTGAFGMVRETGQWINDAILEGAEKDLGLGESVGERLIAESPPYAEYSLLCQSLKHGIPLTVHVAFGTDIIHNHPAASGQATGACAQVDFQIFTHQVSCLNGGGVYLNVGSAVILPEVFLKAVSLVRNSGQELENFTTANLDFIQHYRPLQNVVRRPVLNSGRGLALTGHHEIMIPLLAALLVHGA